MSMFDVILSILEAVISEQLNSQQQSEDLVMTDHVSNTSDETFSQVEIFLSLISDACKEMIVCSKLTSSNKIKSISKVLPYLI